MTHAVIASERSDEAIQGHRTGAWRVALDRFAALAMTAYMGYGLRELV
jgi:hypothetical protein